MKNYLNEIEINEISKLVENETLLQAIKKVILSGVYFEGTLVAGEPANPDTNFAIGLTFQAIQNFPQIKNEDLGRDIRAKVEAIRFIELGFKEFNKYRNVVEVEEKINEAR